MVVVLRVGSAAPVVTESEVVEKVAAPRELLVLEEPEVVAELEAVEEAVAPVMKLVDLAVAVLPKHVLAVAVDLVDLWANTKVEAEEVVVEAT